MEPPATILVADDLEAHREMVSEMLRSQGYQVLLARDGSEAIALLKQHRVDMAVLDVEMPGSSGLEVCRVIKANPETRLTPVIIVTGFGSNQDRISGYVNLADEYITKPLHKGEFLARIHSLLQVKQLTDELERSETVLFTLARSIEAKDRYTEGHCERLSVYSESLAARLGLPEKMRVALRRGGIVHDIGKVAVPDHILLKPGPLTPGERKIMERHTVEGERICAPLKSFASVLPIIRHHHERLDGTGYPDGLRGNEIPLNARILTTVDIYDALTMDRPYRKAQSQKEAFAQMRTEVERGWWDSRLIDEFERLIMKTA